MRELTNKSAPKNSKVVQNNRCKKKVYPPYQWGSFHPYQCTRKAIKDGYCKIHHPDYEKAKSEARDKKWKREWEAQNARWRIEKLLPDFAYTLAMLVLQSDFYADNPDVKQTVDSILALINDARAKE